MDQASLAAATRVRQNVVANFLGKTGAVLMNVAFVPLWIQQMGVEAYGLVGAYASLMAILSVLDLGLSTTLNREFARRSGTPERTQESVDLLRTFEIVCWSVGLATGLIVVILGPPLATSWLNAESLPTRTVARAAMLMGVVIALQWPTMLYSAGLQGLQKHVTLNSTTLVGATLRGAGGAAALWVVAPTVEVFFIWQSIVSGLQTAILAERLWSQFPRLPHSIRWPLFVQNWRFAAGMTGINILVIVLTQVDRVVLSRWLTLEAFGYYSFAATVGLGLNGLVTPVTSALFPRLTELVTAGSGKELSKLYHKTCQIVALFVLPVSVWIALFSRELLPLWLRDPKLIEHTPVLISLLTAGTALNSLMALPYALQLANGWTTLSVYKNLIAVIIVPVTMLVMVSRWGSVGAAVAWILLNAGYVLFEIPVMHTRVLRGEMWRWYVIDVGLPLVVTVAILAAVRWWVPSGASGIYVVTELVAALTVTLLAVGIALPAVREGFVSGSLVSERDDPSGAARSSSLRVPE